jgi:DNA-binding CsgD family transcriptional regulator
LRTPSRRRVVQTLGVSELQLVGREELLDQVLGELSERRAVVMSGAAGVGKSRLAVEVAARAELRGWTSKRVVATRAAASIPFGAMVSLLPDDAGTQTPLALLAALRQRLQDGPDGQPQLLVIDDLPRLDVPSAALVHQVVTERLCAVLGTVRAGEAAPDAVAALLDGDNAVRIDVPSLTGAEVSVLIEAALGGQCDANLTQVLMQLSSGNPLFVRELVRDGVAAGWLAQTGNVWRIAGVPRAPARLIDVVGDRLAALGGPARAAMEVLAIAERLDVGHFDSLAEGDALEQLEIAGLAEIEQTGERMMVVLAHPMHGEAARATIPALRRRRIVERLADVLEASGMTDAGDPVRVARWRLESGGSADADLLARAARQAWMANDFALAEQLGRAARSAGAGFDAAFVVAECLMLTGRHDEAEAAMAMLDHEVETDAELVQLASARANNLMQAPGGEDAAIAILEAALDEVVDEPVGDTIRARLAVVHALAPRPRQAIAAAEPVLHRPRSDQYFRATYATSLAQAMLGRVDEAVDTGVIGYIHHRRFAQATRQLPESQHIGPVLALVAGGRLDEAGVLATEGHHRSVASADAESQATFAMLLGIVATQRGAVVTGVRSFREAAAINIDLNDDVGLRWSLGGAAMAGAMAGDRDASRAARDHLDRIETTGTLILELDLVERGRAWQELAAGDTTRAVERLRSAADVAAATDQFAAETALRHDPVRLGDTGAGPARLAELGTLVGGELVAIRVRHAEALASRDGEGLEAAAHAFGQIGHHVDAMIAARQAASAFRAAGWARPAARCDGMGDEAAARCEGASPPISTTVREVAELTRREREVATLASEGLANREIAERLFLSARTVENHLQHAYEKLGITNRSELPGALERTR